MTLIRTTKINYFVRFAIIARDVINIEEIDRGRQRETEREAPIISKSSNFGQWEHSQVRDQIKV